eukprot:gene16635-19765_t
MVDPKTYEACVEFPIPGEPDKKVKDVYGGFAEREFQIIGYSWIDEPGQGIEKPGSPWLPGMKVEVLDADTKEVVSWWDSVSSKVISTVNAGKYCMRITDPSDRYRPTAVPASGKIINSIDPVTNEFCTFEFPRSDGKKQVEIYGGFKGGPHQLSVFSFKDQNSDGINVQGDQWNPGMQVEITNESGKVVFSFKTGSERFVRKGFWPGKYCVKMWDPTGKTAITKIPENPPVLHNSIDPATFKRCFEFNAETKDVLVIGGFNTAPFSAEIQTFEDKNGDGIKDADEGPLDDVEVELTKDGKMFREAVKADKDGKIKLVAVPAGKYCAHVTKPSSDKEVTVVAKDNVFNPETKEFCFEVPKDAKSNVVPMSLGFKGKDASEKVFTVECVAFNDTNKDGVNDDTEVNIEGIECQLLDTDGKPVGSKVETTKDGAKIPDVKEGEHCLKMSDPKKELEHSILGKDNTVDPTSEKSCFTLPIEGETSDTHKVQGGFVAKKEEPPATDYSIIGNAFKDGNLNGVEDSDDPQLGGLEAVLSHKGGAVVKEFKTEKKRQFKVEKLAAGEYCLKITDPAKKMKPTKVGEGLDNKLDPKTSEYCFTLPAEGSTEKQLEILAGFNEPPPTFTIEGNAFRDVNRDGNEDVDDPAIGGLEIKLTDKEGKELHKETTDKKKPFSFPDLLAGDYCLVIKDPEDKLKPTVLTGKDNKFDPETGKYCFSLPMEGSLDQVVTILAGMNEEELYEITGNAFKDTNGDGNEDDDDPDLAGIHGVLTNEADEEVATFDTERKTPFSVGNLKKGKYCLEMKDPSDKLKPTVLSGDNKIDPETNKHCFDLPEAGSTEPIYTILAGFAEPKEETTHVTISTFKDANTDGTKDDGEDPVAGLEGVISDKNGKPVDTFTTDGSSSPSFDLKAGDYCVKITDPAKKVKTTVEGKDNKFKDSKYCFKLPEGEEKELTISAGFVDDVVEKKYEIKATAFKDIDHDGLYGEDEPLLADVEGVLTKEGKEVGKFTTKRNGPSSIKDLPAGEYCVTMKPKDDKLKTTKMADDGNQIDPETNKHCFKLPATEGEEDKPYEILGGFALPPPVDTYEVKIQTFKDASKDGTKDEGEAPVIGLEGEILNNDGKAVGKFTTDDKEASVKGLPAGDYCLKLVDKLDKVKPTVEGKDNKLNKESKYCFKLPEGEDKVVHISAGFVDNEEPQKKYEILVSAFKDNDHDGLYGENEPLLADVEGILTNKEEIEVGKITTDRNEPSSIKDLPAGEYCLTMKPKDEKLKPTKIATDGNQIDPATNKKCFSLPAEGATEAKPFKVLGGFAEEKKEDEKYEVKINTFKDANKDGTKDDGEAPVPGLEGIVTNNAGVEVGKFTTEDKEASVKDLPAGDYCLKITDKDSKVEPTVEGKDNKLNKESKYCFKLPDGEDKVINIDAGFVDKEEEKKKYEIQASAFKDKDHDGLYGEDEPSLADVEGILTDKEDKEVGKLTTTRDKPASIKDLAAGDYCLTMKPKDEKLKTTKLAENGNQIDPETNKHCFTLPATEGDDKPYKILGGFEEEKKEEEKYEVKIKTFKDANKDGTKDDGEAPVTGLEGIVTNNAGVEVGKFTTEDNEASVKDLPAGDYCLKITDKDSKVQPTIEGKDNKLNKESKYCFKLPDGEDKVINIDAGFVDKEEEKKKYEIQASAFKDKDHDGLYGEEEPSLADVEGILTKEGKEVGKLTTTRDGPASIKDLAAGDYCLTMKPKDDKLKTTKLAENGNQIDPETNKHCFTLPATEGDDKPYKILGGFEEEKKEEEKYEVKIKTFKDANTDGTKDDGEAPVLGLDGIITNNAGVEVGKFTTEDKEASVKDLPAGDYCLKITDKDSKVQPTIEGKDNKLNKESKYCFKLPEGDDKTIEISAGFVDKEEEKKKYEIQASAFKDKDHDGLFGDEEPSLADVEGILTKEGKEVGKLTTTRDGPASIKDLAAGDYCLTMKPKDEKLKTTKLAENGNQIDPETNKHCFTLPATEGDDKPYKILGGFAEEKKEEEKYEVKIKTFKDANTDGIKDDGEAPVLGLEGIVTNNAGIEVGKFTTEDKEASVKDLPAGDYCLKITDKDSKVEPTVEGKDNKLNKESKYCFKLPEGDNKTIEISAGFVDKEEEKKKYEIQASAFKDKDHDGLLGEEEPSLADVEGILTKEGKEAGRLTTTRDGLSSIKDLAAGDYCLEMKPKDDKLKPTKLAENGNQIDPETNKHCFTLPATEGDDKPYKILGGFAEEKKEEEKYEVKIKTFKDANTDGIKDDGEAPVLGLDGILTNNAGVEVGKFTTEDKEASVKDLPAGDYCLKITDKDSKVQPTVEGKDNKLNKESKYCFKLPEGVEKTKEIAAGFVDKKEEPPKEEMYEVVGNIFRDLSSDGIYDSTDPLLAGIEGVLTSKDGVVEVGKFTSDQKNQYSIKNVKAGDYCLTVKDPTGKLSPTVEGKDNPIGKDNKYCFKVPGESKDKKVVVNAGFHEKPKPTEFKITGIAFNDNNGNGDKEDGDDQLDEVHGKVFDSENKEVGTFTTTKDKPYEVTGLKAGKYCVEMKHDKLQASKLGKDNQIDPKDNRHCVEFPLEDDTKDSVEVNGGFTSPKHTVSGFGWLDLNSDGKFDTPTEEVMETKVILYKADRTSVIKQVITEDDGFKFENLEEGDYCVRMQDPSNDASITFDGPDNDLKVDGFKCFTLKDDLVIKGGFERVYSLSGINFLDNNINGAFDKEPYFGPVRLVLTKKDTGETVKTMNVPASRTGFKIRGLELGEYCIKLTDVKNTGKPTTVGKDSKINSAGEYCFKLNGSTVDRSKDLSIKSGFIKK